jgi:hypothetical protein
VAPVELLVDQGPDVHTVDRELADLAVDVDVDHVDPAHHHVAQVETAEGGAVHPARPDLRPAQVDALEPGIGQVHTLEPGAGEIRIDEVSHAPTVVPGTDRASALVLRAPSPGSFSR